MFAWQMWVTMLLKFSVNVKVMNNVNFPKRDLLFYIYASLVAFLEWITPPYLFAGIFYSDCYNLIRNFIWIFLLLLLSYIIIPIVQLESEIGVQFTIHVYNLIIFNFAVMCRSQWDEINNKLNTHVLGIDSTNLNPLDLLRDNTTMKDV